MRGHSHIVVEPGNLLIVSDATRGAWHRAASQLDQVDDQPRMHRVGIDACAVERGVVQSALYSGDRMVSEVPSGRVAWIAESGIAGFHMLEAEQARREADPYQPAEAFKSAPEHYGMRFQSDRSGEK